MKQPELPSDWRCVPLASIADVQTGLALGKSDPIDPIRLPYLRVANVQDGYLDLREIKEVVVERSQVARYSLQHGDVLMTEGGDFDKLGRGHIWHGEIPNCLHQNHVFVVRPHNDLLSYFLTSVTSSDYGRAYFLSCSKQSTNLASINSSQLKAFPVPLPPIWEQEAIISRLSTWDRGIRQLSDLIAAKVRFKQGLMQQLLTGQRRFRKFGKSNEFRKIACGEIPVDWDDVPLREVTEEIRRKNDRGVTHVLTASGQHGLVDQLDYFNRSVAGKSLEGYSLLFKGEFAYNRSLMKGYPFGAIKRLDAYDEGVVSILYLCFRLNSEDVDSDWLAHLFESGLLNSQIRGFAKVGARAHGLLNVASSDFFNMVIPLPSKPEQQAIAAVLEKADREIDLLRKELFTLKEQKKGLMQKLLTGQIRVRGDVR